MRQWLVSISLVNGWMPTVVFAVAVMAMVALLTGALAAKRGARVRLVLMPVAVAAVAGSVGYMVAWLLSDVFVVFGVELGPRVLAWVAAGFAAIGFAVTHIVLRRGAMRVCAVLLVIAALLASAVGINQSYGEYDTIGSLFGEDSYSQADLSGFASRRDLIAVAQ